MVLVYLNLVFILTKIKFIYFSEEKIDNRNYKKGEIYLNFEMMFCHKGI